MEDAKQKLITILQKAHAGERAAALAYGGHWRSLKNPTEIADIRQIEIDEWLHRTELAEMLAFFQAKPLFWREVLFFVIGKSIALICYVCGRFCSTYFAGILENANVCEYGLASDYAEALDLHKLAGELKVMEKTEAEHEIILHKMIAGHSFLPFFAFFFSWGKNESFLPGKCSSELKKRV